MCIITLLFKKIIKLTFYGNVTKTDRHCIILQLIPGQEMEEIRCDDFACTPPFDYVGSLHYSVYIKMQTSASAGLQDANPTVWP